MIPLSPLNKMKTRFYFGFQFSIFKDRQGLKMSYKIRIFRLGREKVWILKRDPLWGVGNPELTPKVAYPEMLTEVPTCKQIQPEDM